MSRPALWIGSALAVLVVLGVLTPSSAQAGTPNCAKQKCVALTFDDGPTATTSDLVEVLGRKKVRATFFMLGRQVELFPVATGLVVDGPHAIGLHTYSHPDLTELSRLKIRRQLLRTRNVLAAEGVSTHLMRPPYGATSRRVHRVTRDLGLAEILWNVDPRDWDVRNAQKITRRVVRHTKPGSIVILHELYPATVKAVGPIIRKLRGKGYVFVTVPELIPELKPGKVYYSG